MSNSFHRNIPLAWAITEVLEIDQFDRSVSAPHQVSGVRIPVKGPRRQDELQVHEFFGNLAMSMAKKLHVLT
jgi:hypothetical protein